jgi:SulP family sulfate permease
VRAVDQKSNDCLQLAILTVEGALFFGAASKFEQEVLEHIPKIRMLIIRMGNVPVIDASGERALLTMYYATPRVRGPEEQWWRRSCTRDPVGK